MENANNPNDVNEQKSLGSIFASLSYKNRIQLMIINEIPETSAKFRMNNNDLYLSSRIYFLKQSLKLKPYLEIGTIINSYGDNTRAIESLFGGFLGAGMVYKLNNYVLFDLGVNYGYKEVKYKDKLVPPDFPSVELIIDRFMFKTGLIFKIY
jgi:hypothetical protein